MIAYQDVLTAEQIAVLLAKEVPPWLLVKRAEADAAARGLALEETIALWMHMIAKVPEGEPIIVTAPTVQAALESEARDIGIFGPRGTGKSRQVCTYVYAHCLKYAAEFPGKTIRWLFVRATFEELLNSTLATWNTAIPAQAGSYNKNEKKFTFRLPKGQKAEVLFWGLDDERSVNKLPSLELSGVVIEEPAGAMNVEGMPTPSVEATVWHNLLPCLRQPRQLKRVRRILVGNPPDTAHWCYDVKVSGNPAVLFVDVPRDESPMSEDYYTGMEEDWNRSFGAESTYVRRYVRGEWLPGLRGRMRPEDVPRIRREDLPTFRAVGATCDPATGSGGDRSVIAVCGFTEGQMAYLLDLRVSSTWDFGQLQDQLFETQLMSLRWAYPQIGSFGIEFASFALWLKHNIPEEEKKRGIALPEFQLKRDSKTAKEERIMKALGSRLAQKRLVVVDDCPNLDELWREMARFNPDKKNNRDDVLDALADMDQVESIANLPYAMQSTRVVAKRDDGAPRQDRHQQYGFHADRRGLIGGAFGTRRLARTA